MIAMRIESVRTNQPRKMTRLLPSSRRQYKSVIDLSYVLPGERTAVSLIAPHLISSLVPWRFQETGEGLELESFRRPPSSVWGFLRIESERRARRGQGGGGERKSDGDEGSCHRRGGVRCPRHRRLVVESFRRPRERDSWIVIQDPGAPRFLLLFPLSYFLPLAFVVPELVWWFIFLKSLCVCYSYRNRTGPLHCGSWFISPKISCSFGVLVGI